MTTIALASRLYHFMDDPKLRRKYAWIPITLALVMYAGLALRVQTLQRAHDSSRSAAVAMTEAVGLSETAIVVANSEGEITAANQAATRLFGVGSLIGRQVHEFCPPNLISQADIAYRDAVSQVRASGKAKIKVTKCEARFPGATGLEKYQIEIRVVPEPLDVVVVAAITPMARLEETSLLPSDKTAQR